MLVGNGYTPGHAAYALELLRADAGVRGSSSGGCDGDHQQAGSGQDRRTSRPHPRASGRAADRQLAQQHTTVSVERATLRLAGLAGADPDGTPWVNRLLDVVRADVGLEHGVALPVWHALRRGHADDLLTLAQKASTGSVTFELPTARTPPPPAATPRRPWVPASSASTPTAETASDDQEDRRRPAQAVDLPDRGHRRHLRGHPAGAGGRPRGRRHHRGDPLDRQSLLDFVPEGATREGSPARTPPRRTSA
jgi:beta-lysine 5,6-aminomutase alpha subunit